jgi:protein fantom
LVIIKEKKQNNTDQPINDSESQRLYHKKIIDLEAQLNDAIGELDKSRHLLITQVKINDDYKKEVFLIQNKMEENKAEFDAKILEYAQILDLRAARIKVN